MKKALSILLSLVLMVSTVGALPFSADATDYQGASVLASSLQTGDTFEMGNYPQSRVTDEDLLTALENISCVMTSYGYMTNTRAATHTYDVVDMSYADFSYNGVFYRKVTMNSYRPLSTGVDVEVIAENTYQDDNGYFEENSYYFKWEPIVWQVLDNEEDGVYVMSQKLLDSQALNNFYESVTWENSSLRAWLNSDFYNKAFSSNEKEKINTATLVNENSPWENTISGGNNTEDNIFILSYNDSKNSSYGFSPEIAGSETRHAQGTDYAQSQGLRVDSENGNSWWLLRTRGSDTKQYTGVNNDGYTDRGYTVHHTDSGIRPAFKLALDAEIAGADVPNGLATETGQTLFHYTFDNNVGDDVSADINNDFYVGGKWQNTAYDLYEDHVYLKDAWLYAKVNDSIRNEENNKKWKIDFSFSLASINLGADRLEHILGITSSTVNTSYNGGSSFGVSTNGKVYFNTTDFENGAIGDTGLKLRDYFYGENNENNQKPLKLSYVYDDGIIRVVINDKIKFTADVSANKDFFENINYLTIGGRAGAGNYFDLYDLKATSFNDCTIHQYDAVETPPTCSEQGFTTYTCILCGQSYVGGYVETVAHTPADAVRENIVLATETTDGSYESVVYCSVCGEEISRDTVTVEKHAHILSEPVRENEIEPDVATLTNGSYDSVVYCSVCGEEISRETVKDYNTGNLGYGGSAVPYFKSGNITYSFDSDTGILTITGSGRMALADGYQHKSPFTINLLLRRL